MNTRKPAWENQFYPGNKDALQKMLQGFFGNTENTTGNICGLIAPHAGYVYSGQTAAHAYQQIQGQSPETVVILAPSHAAHIQGISFFDGNYYETALGTIPVDVENIKKITANDPILRMSNEGHSIGSRAEHAVEVQLPFLQTVLNDFKLIPAVFHDYSWETCNMLGTVLAENLDPDKTLIVASSDFYHGESFDDCHGQDKLAIQSITKGDAEQFCRKSDQRIHMACGAGPIAALMVAANKWNCKAIELIHHTTSADVTKEFSGYIVGYAAIVFER